MLGLSRREHWQPGWEKVANSMATGAAEKRDNPRRRHLNGQTGPTVKEREYLEVIYHLSVQGEGVISAQLARWMGVQPPTVAHAVGQLEKKRYIQRNKRGEIRLTTEGLELAENVVRRHYLLECFLLDVMGMPWHVIHEEAVRLEHALSPAIEERLGVLVGAATLCPHGNPIPGAGASVRNLVPLSEVQPGSQFTLRQVLEEAEENSDLLRYLHMNELLPNHQFFIVDASPSYGVTLRRCNHDITVSPEVANILRGDMVALV